MGPIMGAHYPWMLFRTLGFPRQDLAVACSQHVSSQLLREALPSPQETEFLLFFQIAFLSSEKNKGFTTKSEYTHTKIQS